MPKENNLQTFSGAERIIQLIQKVTPPIIVLCAIVLSCTSIYPWITGPVILMAPIVGIGLSKYSVKKNRSMRWHIAFINGGIVFIACLLSGKHSPSFILGFTNLLFITISFQAREKIAMYLLSFTLFLTGTLLSGMSRYLILEGALCLILYTLMLNQVLTFVIIQGNEILSAKDEILKKNEELNRQNEEIAAQRDEIEQQKELIREAYEKMHEKNKEVMDSIYYASRIQKALITSEKYMDTQLKRLVKND